MKDSNIRKSQKGYKKQKRKKMTKFKGYTEEKKI